MPRLRPRRALLPCICLLLLLGCVRVTPTPEPVTITFAYPPFGGDESSYKALAEAFSERHPHITVELQRWIPWQSADTIDVDVFAVFGEFVWLMREQDSIVALDTFIQQDEHFDLDDLHEPTYVVFDDPLTVEALEWYAKLVHEYEAVLTRERAYREHSVDGPGVGIVTDKVAMWMESFSGTREHKISVNWGMVPLPRDTQSFTQASINGYAISSRTLDPDACWEWVSFLSRETPAGPIPVRKSVLESETYEQRVGGEAVAVAIASLEDAEIISYWTLFTGFRSEMGVLERAVEQIIRGDSTAQEAMDWAQRTANK